MAKSKSKATVMVADGAGGMVQVQDRRFEPPGNWPIRFDVPKEQADSWLCYFYAECGRRSWTSGGFGQVDARENSGSITVNTGGQSSPAWPSFGSESRAGRSRSAPDPQEQPIFQPRRPRNSSPRSTSGAHEHHGALLWRCPLLYDHLAWRGELWLDDTIRLGPPTRQYETALYGPRVILVDALIDCAGQSDFPYAFDQKLHEIAAFLTVVMGIRVSLPENRSVWSLFYRSRRLRRPKSRLLGAGQPAGDAGPRLMSPHTAKAGGTP